MSTFAKLFERDGKQVLVMKDEIDNGDPALAFTFESDVLEHRVCLKISFKPAEELNAWDVLDQAFDKCTEDQAFEFRNSAPGIHL